MGQRFVPTDYADLATALAASNNGDEVVALEEGSPYTGANNRNLDPAGVDPLLIRGQWGEHHTVIDCENVANTRGFLLDNGESANVILDGFTIINGNYDIGLSAGGGIYTLNSSPILRNLIIHDCATTAGGGIYIKGGFPIGQNILIYDCLASIYTGGGLYCDFNATPSFTNLTINGCDAGGGAANTGGGGIGIINGTTLTVNNAIIWGNTVQAGSSGKQIYIRTAGETLNLNNSCYGNGPNDVVNNGVFNPVNCTTDDPLFATGLFGDYYLEQISTGHPANSPCIDTGLGLARDNWLYKRTTRIDEFADVGTVDMGYHYSGVYISGIPHGARPELRWKPLHKILDIPSLAAGAESSYGDRLDLRKKVGLAVTARCIFDASGTGNLRIYGRASEDDDDYIGIYDGADYAPIMELPCDPGEFVQKTVVVDSAPRFLRVYAESLEATHPITEIKVLAAPLGTEELRDEEMVEYEWGTVP